MTTKNVKDLEAEINELPLGTGLVSAWQLCPKCQGTGLVYQVGWPHSDMIFSTAPCVCDVCGGKMIISIATGLPPQ